MRANLALELSRARARILELEEQVAYRDARLVTLEERLDAAERKLEELGGPGSQGRASRLQGAASRRPEVTKVQRAVSTATEPAVAPMKRRDEQARPGSAQPLAGKRSIPMPQARASKVEISPRKDAGLRPSAASAASRPPAANASVEPARPQGGAAAAGADPVPATRVDATNEASKVDAAKVEPAKVEPAKVAAKSAQPDLSGDGDLSRIAGIGPRFEAALRKQGITRLSQVAAWSEADLRQVAKALKIPKSRIVKGRWVESAREAIGASRVSR